MFTFILNIIDVSHIIQYNFCYPIMPCRKRNYFTISKLIQNSYFAKDYESLIYIHHIMLSTLKDARQNNTLSITYETF